MLRRPPTTLTITAEDIAAYEDRLERRRAAASGPQPRAPTYAQRGHLPPSMPAPTHPSHPAHPRHREYIAHLQSQSHPAPTTHARITGTARRSTIPPSSASASDDAMDDADGDNMDVDLDASAPVAPTYASTEAYESTEEDTSSSSDEGIPRARATPASISQTIARNIARRQALIEEHGSEEAVDALFVSVNRRPPNFHQQQAMLNAQGVHARGAESVISPAPEGMRITRREAREGARMVNAAGGVGVVTPTPGTASLAGLAGLAGLPMGTSVGTRADVTPPGVRPSAPPEIQRRRGAGLMGAAAGRAPGFSLAQPAQQEGETGGGAVTPSEGRGNGGAAAGGRTTRTRDGAARRGR